MSFNVGDQHTLWKIYGNVCRWYNIAIYIINLLQRMTVALQFAQDQIFHLLGCELLFTGAQSETKAMQIEEKDLQPNTVGTPVHQAKSIHRT
jgi:hypothetical protein